MTIAGYRRRPRRGLKRWLAISTLISACVAQAPAQSQSDDPGMHPEIYRYRSWAEKSTDSAAALGRKRKAFDELQRKLDRFPGRIEPDELALMYQETHRICRTLKHCSEQHPDESHIAEVKKFAEAKRRENELKRTSAKKTSELIAIDEKTSEIDREIDKLNLIQFQLDGRDKRERRKPPEPSGQIRNLNFWKRMDLPYEWRERKRLKLEGIEPPREKTPSNH